MDIYTDTVRELALAGKSPGSVGPATILIGLRGIYSLTGDSIRIRWLAECPPVCVHNERGRIAGSEMTLTTGEDGSQPVLLVYERAH